MEAKIESLIEKIRKEGVEEANNTSTELVGKAKENAKAILNKAEKEAQEIVENSKIDAAKFQRNAEAALKLAARDVELCLREKIIELFDRVFKKEIGIKLEPNFLNDLILKITNNWAPNGNRDFFLNINKEDKEKLQSLLFKNLREELKKSVSLKVNNKISKGFQIGLKDNYVFYDFSDESILENLKVFLNPEIAAILEEVNG